MPRLECSVCGTDVQNGMAVIRSIKFVQVVWCKPCWQAFVADVTTPKTDTRSVS